MSDPILVTGAAGGTQGSTGRLVASLLMERGIPVRALVHHVDARSDELRRQGAEVVEVYPRSYRTRSADIRRIFQSECQSNRQSIALRRFSRPIERRRS